MKPSGADLHLHTIFSDGTYTPRTLVAQASSLGLRAIAVTDHDTLDGIGPVRETANNELEVISGVEMSADCQGQEIHLLGLFINEFDDDLCQTLSDYRRYREHRIYAIVERLAECGALIEPAEVFKCAGRGSPGRMHVARALVESGQSPNIAAAFGRYLGLGRPAYIPKSNPAAREAIELISKAGGVSIWAHPGLSRRDALLAELLGFGLNGLEVYSSAHSAADERRYRKLARKHALLVTGGSDCHGIASPRPTMGTVRLTDKLFDALRRTVLDES